MSASSTSAATAVVTGDVSVSDPTSVVAAAPGSGGDNQYVDLLAADVYVEIDLDPTFADTVTEAYLYAKILIPSSALPDMLVNFTSSLPSLVQSDDFFLAIHRVGSNFYWWSTGSGVDFAPVTFDDWIEIEMHLVAGNSSHDVKIDGTLYPSIDAFSTLDGINYWEVGSFPATIVGDGGGTATDDIISVDQLAWSVDDWISDGGVVFARWAFDGADPITDAIANYPDPPWAPWENGDPANIVVQSGGDTDADLAPGEVEEGGPDPPQDPIGCCADTGELSARIYIGGSEVTSVAVAGSWTPRLNRPAQATVTLPLDSATGAVGDLLRIDVTDGVSSCIVFHGRILNREFDTAKDDGRVKYNAQDAMELWQSRVVRDDTADFSKPQVITDYLKAPAIMRAVLKNTEGNSTAQGNPALTPPVTAEGPLGILIGGIATGGPDLDGAPVDWPMKVAEMFSLLVSTGQLDGILSYVDPGGGITAQVDFYNGDYGTDRTADVIFQYGMGAFNIDSMRGNEDMTNVVNKYQLFGGPSITTAADPAGDQHWCFNVTGDDTNLARPPGGDVNAPYSGGDAPGSAGNPLGQRRLDSQAAYDVRMQVDIVDGYDEDCIPGFGAPGRDLWRYQWQTFSWLAAMPRNIIHFTPVAGTQIGCFGIGDLIQVEAVADVLGGFAGAQRVYGYTVSWEATPSVLTLSEIETSADNEGG